MCIKVQLHMTLLRGDSWSEFIFSILVYFVIVLLGVAKLALK